MCERGPFSLLLHYPVCSPACSGPQSASLVTCCRTEVTSSHTASFSACNLSTDFLSSAFFASSSCDLDDSGQYRDVLSNVTTDQPGCRPVWGQGHGVLSKLLNEAKGQCGENARKF
ncbi:hypothetical protein MAR_000736 [Mya arenaria]|uniref:Uncharacterized protein n=1 Tax=Mya arenaria TaxID=6604 RepID=A0ABY7F9N9_MYAAR|nr:hypothetical protein MAR_000736 [Mya arenaria]